MLKGKEEVGKVTQYQESLEIMDETDERKKKEKTCALKNTVGKRRRWVRNED